jgi:hypothetical protein
VTIFWLIDKSGPGSLAGRLGSEERNFSRSLGAMRAPLSRTRISTSSSRSWIGPRGGPRGTYFRRIFGKAHSAAGETSATNMSRDTFVPVHPRALRYYREIGVDVPAILAGDR